VEVPDPEHVKAKMTELMAVSGGGDSSWWVAQASAAVAAAAG